MKKTLYLSLCVIVVSISCKKKEIYTCECVGVKTITETVYVQGFQGTTTSTESVLESETFEERKESAAVSKCSKKAEELTVSLTNATSSVVLVCELI